MGDYEYIGLLIGILVFLLIWQEFNHYLERKRMRATIGDLHNRLMARDLAEYTGATRALSKKRMAEADEEISEEDIEQIMDRIPIN